jgi:hypothetical protein
MSASMASPRSSNEAVEKLVIRTSPPSSTINYLNADECTDFFLAFQPKYRF